MISEAVLYQSAMVNNSPFQQLSNLKLDGICTISDSQNTGSGKLYGTFSYSAPNYTLSLYKDFTKIDLVATATATALGVATVNQSNDSGLSGTVNFAQYTADDDVIEVVCLLAVDADIPFNYLNTVSDFDETVGFAEYHILAFNKIKENITSKYRSILSNPILIDTRQINGGTGGVDLSRVLDWSPFHEAAYHYAFAILAQRQAVDVDGMWFKRAQQSLNIYKGYIESVEVGFDLQQKRVENTSRTGCTFKISRS